VTKKRQPADHDATVERIAISILAGGQSTRMGRDKTRLRFQGRSLFSHIRVAAEATGWSVRIIRRDVVDRCGPLGGIYTALKTSRSVAELFLACDMPFVSSALLTDLANHLGAKHQAVFATADGRAGFPFLLRESALPMVEQQIQAKRFSIHSLADLLRAKFFRVPQSRAVELLNINTPADWRKARRLFQTLSDPISPLASVQSPPILPAHHAEI
jgi:molybdopterin-guanine dinucleotide biosynthesis protein A